MSRYVVLASAAAISLAASSAQAAPSSYDWTGFYLGVNGGGGRATWKRQGFYDTNPINMKHKTTGFFGGGQVGYNFQLSSPIVLGIEGDFQAASFKKFLHCAAGPEASNGGACYDDSSAGELAFKQFATLRARLGFTTGHALIYATGGGAYGKIRYAVQDYGNFSTSTYADNGTGTQSKWKSGWVAGAGVEFALTKHWSLKGEALHIDLGSARMKPAPGYGYPSSLTSNDFLVRIKTRADVIRVGINYRFGGS